MVSEFEKTGRPYKNEAHTGVAALTRDATIQQRNEIERAHTENPTGVEQLARRILNDPEIHNPIACFLSKLRNGAHLAGRARTDGMTSSTNHLREWDAALGAENARAAQAMLRRLGKPPASVVERAKQLLPDDDDIPGYGDHT